MAWSRYAIRGTPAGSGDCIFKSEGHACPSRSAHCTSGRGHEPIGHRCRAPPPPPSSATATIGVMDGETLDVRMLVDRPVVEIFVNRGRAAYVAADGGFVSNRTTVALFNSGKVAVTALNVSAYGMECGWTKTKPTPKPPTALSLGA